MRARTIEQLARVKAIYQNAIDDGRSPVDAVARAFGVSETAAKKRIARSKDAGLLGRVPEVFDIRD